MRSLQTRLQVWLAVYIAILIVGLLFVGYNYIRNLSDDFVIDRLDKDIEGILSAIEVHDGAVRISDLRFSHVYDQPMSGNYFVLRYGDHIEQRSRSLWDNTLLFPSLEPGEVRINHIAGPAGQELIIWIRGFRKDDVNFTLAVAQDHAAIHKQINRYFRNISIMSFIGLFVLLIIQRLIVRSSLRNLQHVRDDLHKLAHGEKGSLSEKVPTEILPLVQETNQLLELLSQRLERSRNALGNLAHALKGPLSVVIQFFSNTENMKDAERFVQVGKQVERIQEIMQRELKRARLVGKGVSSQRFNPHREMPDLIGLLRQVHACDELKLNYQISPDIPPFGDREDMHELMGNLLDNACKWAKSSVSCRLFLVEGGDVHIIVEDDGQGLSGHELEILTRRGVRLDETVDGHGLGLSIVKDIIRLYGGQINFTESVALKGLKVHVVLPCEAAPVSQWMEKKH